MIAIAERRMGKPELAALLRRLGETLPKALPILLPLGPKYGQDLAVPAAPDYAPFFSRFGASASAAKGDP
jgi:hypothetical protein